MRALLAVLAVLVSMHAAAAVGVRISSDTSGPSTRVVLTFAKSTSCKVAEQAGRVTVSCDAALDPDPATGKLDDSILTEWRQDGERTLGFATGPGYKRADSFELKNPYRLVLDAQGTRTAKAVEVAPAASQTVPIVVIDPGHGGVETGAVGPGGLQEKDVTLDLARRLKDLLQKQGVTVVLTRDDDRVLPLDDRTAIANQNRAELFLSLHLNASKRKAAVGAETYFLAPSASDADAKSSAAAENASPSAGDATPATPATRDTGAGLDLILWDLAQNSHLAESSKLAEAVQRSLNTLTGVKDRGVRQAPFRVLMGATMPAILVESGFISNPDEESRLKDDAYRDKIAQAVAGAVAEFRQQLAASR
ncbi:MAG TPA: N-acetylmuramoyl-L-alanine amidase [Candidatus Polarisedimenticolaceae bacterium]|nr:N-acetylmuramoyl-L-alanine amidase [Candidatus Polarisedimenticolaceae bacterium]